MHSYLSRRLCLAFACVLGYAGSVGLLRAAESASEVVISTADDAAEPPEKVNLEALLSRASTQAKDRERVAAEALNRARERIASEKVPLLARMRAAESRILAAEGEARRMKIRDGQAGNERRQLLLDVDATRRTASFATATVRESLNAMLEGLPPGERQFASKAMQDILDRLAETGAAPSSAAAMDGLDLMLARVAAAVGGSVLPGSAVHATTNEVTSGRFAFIGPEVYFLSNDGLHAGIVRTRDGASFPVVHPLAGWSAADAARYFSGEVAPIPVDASAGKALRLQETMGSLRSHIEKGGVMALVILATGILAVLMIAQKVRDVTRMRAEDPRRIEAFLAMVARGDHDEAGRISATFRGPVGVLFSAGLKHLHEPKAILEEHLETVLLEQRMFFERRLPLLAVIATAAPLMGLLGTVVGMVKTFALITVFGTGNAAKLSSGISEVLIATELGLAVAIPTLIAHGFLAHRVEKNLAQLEQNALQFVIATERARARVADVPALAAPPSA